MNFKEFFRIKSREEFSKRLTESMKANGLTQTDLATILNTTQQSVSTWCKGKSEPDFTTLFLLCGLLDENLNDLLFFDYNTIKKETDWYIVERIADSKEFRKKKDKIEEKYFKNQITLEENTKQQLNALQELCDEFCKQNKIEDRKINVLDFKIRLLG